MKALFTLCLSVAVLVASGCEDRQVEARKAREDAEARARAEAARKEMEALPKAFKSPPFFKLNKPEPEPAQAHLPEKVNP